MVTTAEFKATIKIKLRVAQAIGLNFLDINAGDLHTFLGGYPGNQNNNRMPACCNAIRYYFEEGVDLILEQPNGGAGATLTIRYIFPKNLNNYTV